MRSTDAHAVSDTSFPVVPRPRLDAWMRARGIDDATFGALIGRTKQAVNRMRKPFGDPDRLRPSGATLTKIVRVTQGDVRPEDFSPPVDAILNGGLEA